MPVTRAQSLIHKNTQQKPPTQPPMSLMFQVEEFPDEVFRLLTGFLTGFDLLKLSYASPALYREQLCADSEIWEARTTGATDNQAIRAWLKRSRVSDQPQSCISSAIRFITAMVRGLLCKQQRLSWRTVYLSNCSLRFPGCNQSLALRPERGGAVGIPANVSRIIQTKSFSIEIWFALQAAPRDTITGGVLLGAQSKHWTVGDPPRYHRPIVHVDSQGTLHCSMASSSKAVATDLRIGRWYHLVLSYELMEDTSECSQIVYLDGKPICSSVSERNEEMKELRHMQLGTGCIGVNTTGKPAHDPVGWNGFNGLIGGCRVWGGVLSRAQMPSIMKDDTTAASDDIKCVWSLMDDPDASFYGHVVCTRTTRPQERYCTETYSEFPLPGPTVPFIFRQVPQRVLPESHGRRSPSTSLIH